MITDRRVTWAVIVTIVAEAIVGLLWIGAATERVSNLEKELNRQAPVNERLARLETETVAIRGQLDRIERRIDARDARHRQGFSDD